MRNVKLVAIVMMAALLLGGNVNADECFGLPQDETEDAVVFIGKRIILDGIF